MCLSRSVLFLLLNCLKHCLSIKSVIKQNKKQLAQRFILCLQRAVGKAEELVKAHQEYQRGLHAFEDWLEQEQEKLGCYTQLEGDVDRLEETLQKLQV